MAFIDTFFLVKKGMRVWLCVVVCGCVGCVWLCVPEVFSVYAHFLKINRYLVRNHYIYSYEYHYNTIVITSYWFGYVRRLFNLSRYPE